MGNFVEFIIFRVADYINIGDTICIKFVSKRGSQEHSFPYLLAYIVSLLYPIIHLTQSLYNASFPFHIFHEQQMLAVDNLLLASFSVSMKICVLLDTNTTEWRLLAEN